MTHEELSRELARLLEQSDPTLFAGTCLSVAAHVALLSGCGQQAWELAAQGAFDTAAKAAAKVKGPRDSGGPV